MPIHADDDCECRVFGLRVRVSALKTALIRCVLFITQQSLSAGVQTDGNGLGLLTVHVHFASGFVKRSCAEVLKRQLDCAEQQRQIFSVCICI